MDDVATNNNCSKKDVTKFTPTMGTSRFYKDFHKTFLSKLEEESS
jgi:hypothetical protein